MILSNRALRHLRGVADLPDLHETKYRILERVAAGGMGSVYLVEDAELHRRVALKVIDVADATGDLAARMVQEARIIAGLEHPGIVPVHDVGTLPDGRVYYTMKYVQGSNLAQFARQSGALGERLRVFQRVCEAMAFAHARGVVHRDLKPENIMIGDFGEALIMDWGIAKLVDTPTDAESASRAGDAERETGAALSAAAESDPAAAAAESGGPDRAASTAARSDGSETASETERAGLPEKTAPGKTAAGAILGTPDYMSPEQATGRSDLVDHRSDIFSLGAILAFLIHGSPRPGKTAPEGTQGARVAKPLKAIMAKAMAEAPADRYPGALALAGDVDRYLSGLKVSAHAENVFEALWRWIKKNKFITILVLTYLVMRLLIFVWRGL